MSPSNSMVSVDANAMAHSKGKKFPLWRFLTYGIGGLSVQLLDSVSCVFLTPFLLETAKVGAYFILVIMLVARILHAVTDPIVGYLVFQTHTRIGQKRPW